MPESCNQWIVSSQEEIEYLKGAFRESLGDICDHPIIYCKVCLVVVSLRVLTLQVVWISWVTRWRE